MTLQSGFSKSKDRSTEENIFFNGIMFLTIALMFTPYAIKNGITLATLICGIITGLLSVVYQYFYISAFKIGKIQ